MTASSTSQSPPRKFLHPNMRTGLLLISPWLAGLLIFKIVPILVSFGFSFTNFYMLTPGETQFTGLQNYLRIFQDEAVGYVLFSTISLALFTIPLQMLTSILLAALLSSAQVKNKTALRTLFFLPSIIPSIAILFMWFGFIDPSTGWLNRMILEPLGLIGITDVFSEGSFNLLMAVMSLWSIGPGFLILLAALQGIPPEIEEAARVDGAGPLVRFFMITLPLISPAIFFSLILNLISLGGGVILLDRGNIFSGSISPYDGYVADVMFRRFDLGYAASLAWVFFALMMVLILALFSSSRRWVYYPDKEG